MKLKDFAEVAGFQIIENKYIKDSNNFKITLVERQQGYVNIILALVCTSAPVSKEQLNSLKEAVGSKKIGYLDYKLKNVLAFNLDNLFGKVKNEKVANAIDLLDKWTELMPSLGILPQTKCIYCGLDKEDEEVVYTNYNGFYLPQHLSCREQAKQKVKEMIEEDNKNLTNLPISILLSTIGSFLAALLINLVSMFLLDGTVYALMYIIIPFAAYFGYKLGKSPKSKVMLYTVIGTSYVGTFIVDLCFYALMASAENMSFGQFLTQYQSDILQSTFVSFAFLAIGIILAWKAINKTTDQQERKF